MITYLYKNLKEPELQHLEKFRTGAWIHAEAPTEEELSQLVDKFNLDEGHLKDALDIDEVPRYEVEDDTTYIFTRYSFRENGRIRTAPVLIVVGAKFVLTVSALPFVPLARFTEGRIAFYTTQKSKLLLQILAQIISTYSVHVNSVNRQIKSVRTKLNAAQVSNRHFIEFVELEDVLNDFLSELITTSAIFSSLLNSRRSLVFYEEDTDLIEDLSLAAKQLIETSRSNLRTIVNIREAYSNILTNNLNRQIKLLTTLTVILTVPTITASLFGMNVPVPFAESPLAFPGIVLATMAFVGAMLGLSYRRGWL